MHCPTLSVLTLYIFITLQAYNTTSSGYYTQYYISHVRRPASYLAGCSAVGRNLQGMHAS
jgi:hypothetical protein